MNAVAPIRAPHMRAFTATVSRSDLPESSIQIGQVAVGRDGDEYLFSLRNPDGIVLTARLSGYFFDRFANNLAALVEDEVDTLWAARTKAETALRPLARAVADRFGVPHHQLFAPSREQEITRIRQAFYWVAKQALHTTNIKIARHVGYDDPTTVGHSIRRAEVWRNNDPTFRAATDALLDEYRIGAAQ